MSLYIMESNPKLRALERYENFDGPEDIGPHAGCCFSDSGFLFVTVLGTQKRHKQKHLIEISLPHRASYKGASLRHSCVFM